MKKFLGVSVLTLLLASAAMAAQNDDVACTATSDRSVAGTVDATANAGSQPGQTVQTSGEVDQKKDQKK